MNALTKEQKEAVKLRYGDGGFEHMSHSDMQAAIEQVRQEVPEVKEYVVIWHYVANYGEDIVKATSAEEAIRNHLYFRNKEVAFYAFENNNKTSAVKRKNDADVLNANTESDE